KNKWLLLLCCLCLSLTVKGEAQSLNSVADTVRLNTNWYARQSAQIALDGSRLTDTSFTPQNWLKAVVPGTILTTLLRNGKYKNPNIAFNNKQIPDVAESGSGYYTYWYYTTFRTPAKDTLDHIWLHFRGINYSAQIFLNGRRINRDTHHGMFLREKYDISRYLRSDTLNQLAVLVAPQDPPGVANGGQAGNGRIGKSVTNQYVAGWDWIAPVHDRNTGIWDKVFLTKNEGVQIRAPFVRSEVPGVRKPGDRQAPAYLKTSLTLFNEDSTTHDGSVTANVAAFSVRKHYQLAGGQKKTIALPVIKIDHPKLWWPNGLGPHPLYTVRFAVSESGSSLSDEANLQTGIRKITTYKDSITQGRIFKVNGQPVFIRGGNWIASDWMLRLSKKRYDAQIRYMADMHLNMLRVWGGSITERPDFYKACDRNGILVMQDLWITGDADGAWHDPKKRDSRQRRRAYPDNHTLFLNSARDQIKMLRNHPSLCFWTGGNEIAPPPDINKALRNRIMPKLDPDRLYISHSTAQKLYTHSPKVNADGPYGIQPLDTLFEHHSRPFNPEIGSVGLPVASTLHKIFPGNDSIPDSQDSIPADWKYHKYMSYTGRNGRNYIRQYGAVNSMDKFARYAQLANYNQYRALFEGWNAHMWKWYTGVLIWKLQNPWTALRGEMFDWYLHPNGGMYGLMHGAEPVHIQYDPVTDAIQTVNNTFTDIRNAHVSATWYNLAGHAVKAGRKTMSLPANREKRSFGVQVPSFKENVYFLNLLLKNSKGKILSRNFYWLHNPNASYRALHELKKAKIRAKARINRHKNYSEINVIIRNREKVNHGPVAFWMRLKLIDPKTEKLIAPVFYSDNYISLVPGEKRSIQIRINNSSLSENEQLALRLTGWNVKSRRISLKN
ncbi:MAG TPA: glycoside hydrolase family 2 TIM barrel-domain containing protein, partial [Balneolaceae bacterium]|nr:glycoside hydrolase family 2 TIM barrel-domain containing protein [Balneolaceae bacterium]